MSQSRSFKELIIIDDCYLFYLDAILGQKEVIEQQGYEALASVTREQKLKVLTISYSNSSINKLHALAEIK